MSQRLPAAAPDRILRETAVRIGSSPDLGETLRAVARAARRALGADRATCYVVEPEQDVVSAVYTTEEDPRRRAVVEAAAGRGPNDLPIWRVILSRPDPLLVIEDLSASAEVPRALAARLGSGALVGLRLEHRPVPDTAAPELLGTIFWSYRRPRTITAEDRSVALGLGSMAALALANARLHAQALHSLDRAEREAETDELTGLANRRGLDRRIEEAVARRAPGGRLSAIVLDLDGFAGINDRHGHCAGDDALRAVARAVEASLRPADLAGRLGGEEFLVLLPDTGSKGAWLVAERLRSRIADLSAAAERLTASLGVATMPDHAASAGELLRAADSAMYAAKATGRNRSLVFEPRAARSRVETSRLAQAGREAYLGSILTLAAAVDARDPSTHAHSATVARYAAAIAAALGLGGDRIEEVRVAGLLHDVGKVGVSDAVLLKPGPLTPADWSEMRRHPEVGAGLLVHPGLAEVREWILRHHERPDGGGYPGGLRAGRIPREALILGVADAYEAMTADRPYRRALTPAEARNELARHRGTQFDPEAVDAFLECLAADGAAKG